MKLLCNLVLVLLLLQFTFALQVYPQSIAVGNQTERFSFYVSEDFIFNSTCPEWFTFDGVVVYVPNRELSYAKCTLYFSAARGLETVAVTVGLLEPVLDKIDESVNSIELMLPKNQTGVELVVDEVMRESTLGAFVGSIELPKLKLSTLGAILFTLFFVSVVFLLIPKN